LQQGKFDLETRSETLCAYLVESLAKVNQDEVQECRQLARHSEDGHRGAQWTLERAYPRDFGNNALACELLDKLDKMNLDKEHRDAIEKVIE